MRDCQSRLNVGALHHVSVVERHFDERLVSGEVVTELLEEGQAFAWELAHELSVQHEEGAGTSSVIVVRVAGHCEHGCRSARRAEQGPFRALGRARRRIWETFLGLGTGSSLRSSRGQPTQESILGPISMTIYINMNDGDSDAMDNRR